MHSNARSGGTYSARRCSRAAHLFEWPYRGRKRFYGKSALRRSCRLSRAPRAVRGEPSECVSCCCGSVRYAFRSDGRVLTRKNDLPLRVYAFSVGPLLESRKVLNSYFTGASCTRSIICKPWGTLIRLYNEKSRKIFDRRERKKRRKGRG